MPFNSFTSLGEVALAYQIVLSRGQFIAPLPFVPPDYFRDEIAFTLSSTSFANSETAICESLIYPTLRVVWKPYASVLALWSHEPLHFDDVLTGTPDYFVARQSPLGLEVVMPPYLLVFEAKRDDFTRGWGQCLAAMIAAQKLNGNPDQPTYGIASTGRSWEFGRLIGNTFTRDPRSFSVSDLDELCAAVHYTIDQCRQQVESAAVA